MKVFFEKSYKAYKNDITQDEYGYEIEAKVELPDIKGNTQSNISQEQITLYGTRIKNILNLYSNEDISEDVRIVVDEKDYKIISKKKYQEIPPTHYVYEIEVL